MKFLRRGASGPSGTESAPDGSDEGGHTRSTQGGKGRPTPKRRDAEGRRRGPAPPPPRTQRESMRLARQNRANRDERRKAAAARGGRAGRERKDIPERDRGPVKAYVRDVVDSRRHLAGLFLPLAMVNFIALVTPAPLEVKNLMQLATMALMVSMVFEAVLFGRQLTRRARERFPNEKVSGASVGWYAFSRTSQPRRLRFPKPRVERGAKV